VDRQHGAPGGREDVDPPDRELIDRVRDGDLQAYDPLYRRHERSALVHARHWARTEASAQDLRAEAFTRVLYAIRNGNGPTEAFRPYLLTTMRHVARDWAESDKRVNLVADLADLEAPEPAADPVIAALERSLAGQAFMVLPEQWQTVLWHTEVEGEGPAQLAPVLGLEASAVAALAYRAREGLKQAYLQAHITEIASESCRPHAEKLGKHVRRKLGARDKGKVENHLRHCAECAGLFAMLKYINDHIAVLIGPAVVGGAVAVKGLLLVAAGAVSGAAATGGAGSAGSAGAVHGSGLLARGAAKARNAGPRQQVVAAVATAAVIAGIAFALTGGHPAEPPKPRPKPAAAPPASSPAPPPPSPGPSPSPSASPSHPAPPPTPTKAAPPPVPSTRPPSSPAPPAPSTAPPPPPKPSPSPTHVNCPGITLNVLGFITVEIGLSLEIGDAGQDVIVANCPTGPPRPF